MKLRFWKIFAEKKKHAHCVSHFSFKASLLQADPLASDDNHCTTIIFVNFLHKSFEKKKKKKTKAKISVDSFVLKIFLLSQIE